MNTLSSLLKFIANGIAPIISNQTAKKVLAAPNGATGKPSFRELGASDITSGTFATERIPNLDASKINSGTINTSRVPDLDASKVTSGVFDEERLPNLGMDKVPDALAKSNLVARTTAIDNQIMYDTYDSFTIPTDPLTLEQGYTLIGVVAVRIINATSSGANAAYVLLRGYTFSSTTGNITVYVRKVTNENARIRISVTGLYKK